MCNNLFQISNFKSQICVFLSLSLWIGVSGLSAQTGSIWQVGKTAHYQSLYADSTAVGVGDLINIVVNLTTSSTKDQQTNTQKQNSLTDGLTSLFYNPAAMNPATPDPNPNADWNFFRYHGAAPSFSWGGDRAQKGGGTIQNKEGLTTTIQARVVDALPNGTLRIEARRKFETGQEKSDLILTGLVRHQDLDKTNSISSDKIADLQIKQEGTGTLSRDQQKGWFTKIYESINPF